MAASRLTLPMNQMTDEELVSAHIHTHETQHFTQLYKRYYDKVYAHCLGFADVHNQAADLTQDVFERVLQKLDTFGGNSRFSTWLYAVCRNYCLTEYQHRQRRGRAVNTYGLGRDEFVYPDAVSIQEQRLVLLEMALRSLSDDERQLLLARYEQDNSINQLAVLVAASPSAVKMRLWRVRDRLRQAIQQPTC